MALHHSVENLRVLQAIVGQALRPQRQQLRGNFLQGFFFIIGDVAVGVFRKAEYEDPSAAFVGGYQRAKAATLALPRSGNSLFQEPAAQIGFVESLRHFTETRIGKRPAPSDFESGRAHAVDTVLPLVSQKSIHYLVK
ncbi:MAG: hypothetical protein ACRERU_21935 [Methylococcales bacterium]